MGNGSTASSGNSLAFIADVGGSVAACLLPLLLAALVARRGRGQHFEDISSRTTAKTWALRVLILALAAIFVSRTPALGVASEKSGTFTVSEASLGQTIVAITNALGSCRYHGMGLTCIPVRFDTSKGRWTSEPATNEWILDTYNFHLSLRLSGAKRGFPTTRSS